MSAIELNTIVHDLLSVRSMIEELQAEAETLTDKLKAAMVERGEETISGDGWRASWKNVTSSHLDGKALKAANPDIYAAVVKTINMTRFTITV